jgi:hypothetical protein
LIQKTLFEFEGKKLLGLLVVSGLAFSGISSFIINDGFGIIQTHESVPTLNPCDVSICGTETFDTRPQIFVQQNEALNSDIISNTSNEIFTDLTFIKNKMPTTDYQLFGNKATLFAEKDSFIREGIKNTNEGSNEVLRVMGIGPTNNRAMVAFSQDDINAVSKDKTLQSATLKLFVVSNDENWDRGQDVNLHRINGDWIEGIGNNAPLNNLNGIESGVSWKCSQGVKNCSTQWNGGNFVESPTTSVIVSNHIKEGYWIKFDVTEDVKDYLSGTPNYGWIIKKSNEDSSGRINFAARESNSHMPELVMVFSK